MTDTEQLHTAYWLICSWASSTTTPALPVSDGSLALALKQMQEAGELPDWIANKLHFAESRTGLVCVELEDILNMAQTAQIAEPADTTYRSLQHNTNLQTREYYLRIIDMRLPTARNYGRILRNRVQAIQSQLATYPR